MWAICASHLQFALAEPGLYRTLFSTDDQLRTDPLPVTHATVHRRVGTALDALVRHDQLGPDRRGHAATAIVAAARGLGLLIATNRFAGQPGPARERAAWAVLRAILDGILAD